MAESLPADLAKVAPSDAWKPWKPTAAEWSRKWAAHLYRRAAFGETPPELDRALTAGFDRTFDRLMSGEPDASERWELLAEVGEYLRDQVQLRGWWLRAMLDGGHPLREKLTLFWHNHFATSIAKILDPRLMFRQNLTLRKHALGEFRPFLLAMSRDTAMLIWLDSNSNVKGRPNENYAREIMELFSLGVGNYTEKDIQEAARAFTGWHHDPSREAFEFNPALHDAGPKTVLGRTGNLDGADVVKACCDQPACGRFLVGKLYAFFVSETPPPAGLLAPLEAQFRGSNYNIADLVRTMLGSRLFFSEHAYRKRVKWPVEYVLAAIRGLVPGSMPPGDLVQPLAKMGQSLFAPPNVKGWRTGTDWLNSATLLARNNFAEAVAMGNWSRGEPTFPRPLSPDAEAAEVAEADALAVSEPDTGLTLPDAATAAAAAMGAAAAYGPSGAKELGGVADAPPKPPSPQPGKKKAASKSTVPAVSPDRDVLKTLFATKPANVRAIVKRMGEVLFGEAVHEGARKRTEKFLLDGKPSVTSKEMETPEFRHRVREAMHALMCLPEYQLS